TTAIAVMATKIPMTPIVTNTSISVKAGRFRGTECERGKQGTCVISAPPVSHRRSWLDHRRRQVFFVKDPGARGDRAHSQAEMRRSWLRSRTTRRRRDQMRRQVQPK